MAKRQGQFVRHELRTEDAASAARFYAHVIDWNAEAAMADGVRHIAMRTSSQTVATIVEISDAVPDQRPADGWVAYLSVQDVDDAATSFLQRGGAMREPASWSEAGRRTLVADPQGALIGLITPTCELPEPEISDRLRVGGATWHELYVDNPGDVFRVYSEVFGWEQIATFDMGPAGLYHVLGADGERIGGMMRRPPELSTNYWNVFFQVENITSAEERVRKSGGLVFDGPRAVPGGFTLKCFDNLGVMFALSSANQ